MASKRSTIRKRLRFLIASLLIFCGVLLLISAAGLPYLSYWADQPSAPKTIKNLRDIEWLNTVQWLSIQVIVILWVFSFGATIGSFLNVLVYRLPMGKSILGGSKCPFCAVPIKIYHNVPVFGWIWLGGRCRACRLPIAIRYPVVEFVAGCGFLYLFVTQLIFSAGIGNEQQLSSTAVPNVISGVFQSDIFDLLRFLWHCALFSSLLTWGLIQWDRRPLPMLTLMLSLLAALATTIALPELMPTNQKVGAFETESTFIQSCVVILSSLLLAVLTSVVLFGASRLLNKTTGNSKIELEMQVLNFCITTVLIAVWIGWHGAIVVLTCGVLVQIVLRQVSGKRKKDCEATSNVSALISTNHRSMLLSVCVSTVLILGFYRWFVSVSIWPSFESAFWISILWSSGLLITFCVSIAMANESLPGNLESGLPQDQQSDTV